MGAKKGQHNSPATEFKKGQSGNPAGPRKLAINILKDIPQDSKERVYRVLHTALMQPTGEEALKYLREHRSMEYGIVFEVYTRELTGDRALTALESLMDRLYGKPRQQTDVTFKGGDRPKVVFGEDEQQ